MNSQGHIYDSSKSRPGALLLLCLDSARVWLSCQTGFWFLRYYVLFSQIQSQLWETHVPKHIYLVTNL